MRILITGGAGFVGNSLACQLKEKTPGAEITVLDNLKRRGAELNLPGLRERGIHFAHGDIRQPSDLQDLPGNFDLFIEAAAEPSVRAGEDGSPDYVLQTNLNGTLHCLDFARRRAGAMVFLSTSRVYSIEPLRQIPLVESGARLELAADYRSAGLAGLSEAGISEEFPRHLPRSFYGASKLASEMMVQEYCHAYGLKAVIDRCGVLAGPGQFGKTDQGVFTLWVARHLWNGALRYTGFGGQGLQVRDLLHPADLLALLERQVSAIDSCSGEIFNVGGGRDVSVSLAEWTGLCTEACGNAIPIAGDEATNSVDIPWYISDNSRVNHRFGWRPARGAHDIAFEIAAWLRENEARLRPLFQ